MSPLKTLLALGALLLTPFAARAVPVNVVLLGGQSNMDGRASTSGLPLTLQQSQSDVLYDNGYSSSNGYTNGQVTALRPGSSQFGPEVSFGRTITDDHPGSAYALIKYAVGGTSLAVNWKAPTSGSPSTGTVYAAFKTSVANSLSALTSAGYTYNIVGMLWLQGESDATASYAASYQQNLSNFIADIRTTYGANLPFIIGGIGNDGDIADTATVSAAQANLASTLTNVRYFSNSDLWPSAAPLHFDAAGQQTIGQRYATQLESVAVPEPASAAAVFFALAAALRLRRVRAS